MADHDDRLDPERRVSIRQAAQILGVSDDTIRRHHHLRFKRISPGCLRARLGDLLDAAPIGRRQHTTPRDGGKLR